MFGVARAGLKAAGEAYTIGSTIYGLAHPHVESIMADDEDDWIEVEAPLLRAPIRKPPTMHPLEQLHMGTQILTGLGETGAGMYN